MSTLNSPVSEAALGGATGDHRTIMMSASSDDQLDNVNDDEDDVATSIENVSSRNNLSGSYSNLFRADKLDDEADDVIVRSGESMQMGDNHLFGAGLVRENVYSNVPFGGIGSAITSSTLMHSSPEAIHDPINDPSLHVYSNVVNLVTTNSAALHDISFGGVSAILASNTTISPPLSETMMHKRRFSGEGQASSTMVADDMDLDDPVTVAGVFSQTPNKRPGDHNQVAAGGGTNPAKGQTAVASHGPHSARKSSAVAIEMANVIPQVRFAYPHTAVKSIIILSTYR